MNRENYKHIFYRNCPHFTYGRVDQWGEQGYLFHDGFIYEYEEDRKEQSGRTFNKMSIDAFLEHYQRHGIEVPSDFLDFISNV